VGEVAGPKVGDQVDVEVLIVRYFEPEPQPGVVEFSLADRFGREWLFREKVPYVSDKMLDEGDFYPLGGTLRGTVVSLGVDAIGRQFIEIDTYRACLVETVTGISRFEVFVDQLQVG
jgi:hypothetical protein